MPTLAVSEHGGEVLVAQCPARLPVAADVSRRKSLRGKASHASAESPPPGCLRRPIPHGGTVCLLLTLPARPQPTADGLRPPFPPATTEPMPRAPEPTDVTLVQSAQAGDLDALNCLLSRHRPAFIRRAECACGDPTEAQDVCQEACLKATHSLVRFVAGRSFRAWVFAFIDNEAKNWRRNLKKVCTPTLEIDIHIMETMSADADNKSEADLRALLAMLSGGAEELRKPSAGTAAFMLEYYAEQQELPSVRAIAQATHTSHGAAQLNRRAILASWRRALAAAELQVPTHRKAQTTNPAGNHRADRPAHEVIPQLGRAGFAQTAAFRSPRRGDPTNG